MQIDDITRIAAGLPGVRISTRDGLAQWRYHGRVVARQLDEDHVVIRAGFDDRDDFVRRSPQTFSIPAQFRRHMMVVADLCAGDLGAIEGAIEAGWALQRAAD